MNQEKIGALIASLRKQLGLTQSELGAKVGVGDRAVSKWERGITCPDISIINELSSILGITSDELLSGELNKEHKQSKNTNKFNKKYLLLIPILLIIMVISIIIINNNKTYVYSLISESSEYDIAGNITFKNNQTTININKIAFTDNTINNAIIKNYEYSLRTADSLLVRSGYLNRDDLMIDQITVVEFTKSFNINYNEESKIERKIIVNNGLILKITFLDIDDNRIDKEIKIKLEK